MMIIKSHKNLFTPHNINNIVNRIVVCISVIKAKYENLDLSRSSTVSVLNVVYSVFKLLV